MAAPPEQRVPVEPIQKALMIGGMSANRVAREALGWERTITRRRKSGATTTYREGDGTRLLRQLGVKHSKRGARRYYNKTIDQAIAQKVLDYLNLTWREVGL